MEEKERLNSEENSDSPEENGESKLEEEIEEIEKEESIIDENKFIEVLNPDSNFSPVLEKIEGSQEKVTLEESVSEVFVPQKKEEKKVEYDTGYDRSDYETVSDQERKILNENLLVRESRPIVLERQRDFSENFTQEFKPTINPELREMGMGSSLDEDYVARAGRIEREEKLPFQEQAKYKGKVF